MLFNIYQGELKPDGTTNVSVLGVPYCGRHELSPRSHLLPHSPKGFAWGCVTPQSMHLALCLLAHHTGHIPMALQHHEAFTNQVVARWPATRSFTIDSSAIEGWLSSQEHSLRSQPVIRAPCPGEWLTGQACGRCLTCLQTAPEAIEQLRQSLHRETIDRPRVIRALQTINATVTALLDLLESEAASREGEPPAPR